MKISASYSNVDKKLEFSSFYITPTYNIGKHCVISQAWVILRMLEHRTRQGWDGGVVKKITPSLPPPLVAGVYIDTPLRHLPPYKWKNM